MIDEAACLAASALPDAMATDILWETEDPEPFVTLLHSIDHHAELHRRGPFFGAP